jgi:hypothetical protein
MNPNYRKYIIRTRYEDELKCWVAYQEINPTTQIIGETESKAVANFMRHDLGLDNGKGESES